MQSVSDIFDPEAETMSNLALVDAIKTITTSKNATPAQFAKIVVQGDRLPEAVLRMTGL